MNAKYQLEEECKHKTIKTITYIDYPKWDVEYFEYCKDCDARINEVR